MSSIRTRQRVWLMAVVVERGIGRAESCLEDVGFRRLSHVERVVSCLDACNIIFSLATSWTRISMSRSQRLTERGRTMLRCVGRAYTKVPFIGESEVFAATSVYMVSSSCCDAISRSSIW